MGHRAQRRAGGARGLPGTAAPDDGVARRCRRARRTVAPRRRRPSTGSSKTMFRLRAGSDGGLGRGRTAASRSGS